MTTPNPGSDAAIAAGCTCPVMDNNHGYRCPTPWGYWIDASCPMHGARPVPRTRECGVEVSTRPWWMGVDQYDPCLCVLDNGHNEDHQCSHGATK